jgi:hypothetical protein
MWACSRGGRSSLSATRVQIHVVWLSYYYYYYHCALAVAEAMGSRASTASG